jgi:hypothetical protein
MTMQTIAGVGMTCPEFPYIAANTFAFSSALMDAGTEKVAFVGTVFTKDHAAKNITKIGFRPGTVSLNALSFIKTSIQSVSTASGPPATPTGTILGATANGFVTEAAATFSSNTWHQTAALGEVVAVNPGDIIAVVIEYGTFTAADAFNVTNVTAPQSSHLAQTALFTASWGVQSVLANVVLEFDDGTFGTLDGAFPCSGINGISYASNTAGADEYALEFSFPFPVKVDGGVAMLSNSAAGANFDIVLYDGTTALETIPIDGNQLATTSNTRGIYFGFTQQQSLAANTTYRLALKPTTTSSVSLSSFDVAAVGHFQAHPMGAGWVLGSRIDAGAWSAPTATRRPMIFVRVSACDDGTGGGGGGNTYSRGRIVNQ